MEYAQRLQLLAAQEKEQQERAAATAAENASNVATSSFPNQTDSLMRSRNTNLESDDDEDFFVHNTNPTVSNPYSSAYAAVPQAMLGSATAFDDDAFYADLPEDVLRLIEGGSVDNSNKDIDETAASTEPVAETIMEPTSESVLPPVELEETQFDENIETVHERPTAEDIEDTYPQNASQMDSDAEKDGNEADNSENSFTAQ
jgi:hypothetical protein